MHPNIYRDVLNFNREVIPGVDRTEGGVGPPPAVSKILGIKLVKEEFEELVNAAGTYVDWEDQVRASGRADPVEVADAIADMLYVIIGVALRFGIDEAAFYRVWREVTRANMAKAGGPTREDGKRLKPEGWTPPDVKWALYGKASEG